MPNIQKIIASSAYDGFKNILPTLRANTVFPSTSLAASTYRTIRTDIKLPSSNELYTETVQIKHAGIDTYTYLVQGLLAVNYPNNNSVQYQLESLVSVSTGVLHVDTYIVNQVPITITVPTIDFQVTVFPYIAPF